MTVKTIYFIFVNFNDSETTIRCIESIEQLVNIGSKIRTIIIDNASNIVDYDLLRQKCLNKKNVALYRSEENLGYFGGLNLGISKIYSTEDHYVVIGNNDLLFPENFLELLQGKISLFESYPVVSPNIITLDGVHQNPHVIKNISRFREIIFDLYFLAYPLALLIKIIAKATNKFTDRKDELQHAVAQTISQGYGACYILGPLFFKHFNNLWAPTFLMGEELFLSKQLEGKGFKIFYEPSIIVKHCLHTSMAKIPGKRKWKIERDSHKIYRKYVKIWS
ncbi:MAG: glycosyltransferase family 2 protein [Bacteroidales bacterium]|jgi:GT2 family glycosyltransferase